eukprot:565038_1
MASKHLENDTEIALRLTATQLCRRCICLDFEDGPKITTASSSARISSLGVSLVFCDSSTVSKSARIATSKESDQHSGSYGDDGDESSSFL